jgi:hypothetical protein
MPQIKYGRSVGLRAFVPTEHVLPDNDEIGGKVSEQPGRLD